MKIGIETTCLSHTIRGIGTYSQALIQALLRENAQILCYQNKTSKIYPTHLFPSLPKLPFLRSIAALTRSQCYEKCDLIHFPDPKILYGKRPNKPIAITIHDLMPLILPDLFPKKSQWMMKYFFPKYLKDADAIICPSRTTKNDLIQIFNISKNKIHLIPLTTTHIPAPILMQKEPFILYIGSFEPRKNLEGILHAFSLIKKRKLPHKLILAGKEEGKNRIPRHLISKLGIEKEIEITGYITEETKRHLYQTCHVFLWPTLYEGFGIPLLEAMQAGAPIVTTQGGAMQEVVGNAALLVDPKDPEKIASAVGKILSSKELADSLIQKGLERAEAFSLEAFGKNHLNVYSKII